MSNAVKECEASSFDPTGYKAKENIKELRDMVEIAVGCAFEENLFNANGGAKGGKESRPRSPRAPGANGAAGRRGGGGKRGGRGKRGGKSGRGGKRR